MQVITHEGVAVYAVEDDIAVTMNQDNIVIGDWIIKDMHSGNVILYTDVTDVPEDFIGGKYFYTNGSWTLSPNWDDSVLEA